MTSNVRVVNLVGDITTATVTQFVEPLREALAAPMVLVSLSQATEIDLAGIQLLYAAARSARDAGTPLHFTGALPDTIVARLVDGGFLDSPDVDARGLARALAGFDTGESQDD